MHIITDTAIKEYYRKHADSENALKSFMHEVKRTQWRSLADIKKSYNSVDYLGNDRYCFNIKGNHYRLIALILFPIGKVYIRFIGTHAEYNKLKDATNI